MTFLHVIALLPSADQEANPCLSHLTSLESEIFSSFQINMFDLIQGDYECLKDDSSLSVSVVEEVTGGGGVYFILNDCSDIMKPHRISALSFSTTFRGISHFYFGTFSPYSAQVFLYTIPGS